MMERLNDLLKCCRTPCRCRCGCCTPLSSSKSALLAISLFLVLRYAKFLGYMFRNTRRNVVRSVLTVGSIAISLFLMMTLFSLLAMISEAATKVRDSNRLIVLSSQGFAQPVPIATVNQVKTLQGVQAASPLSWYGGKYNEEVMPFAQFGIDPTTIFTIYDEFDVPEDQLKAFQQDRAGCVHRPQAGRRPQHQGGRSAASGRHHLPLQPEPDRKGHLRRARG